MELISTEYIYLSASVIAFRKQYDQLLVILGLSRYQTTGRFPGWKILIQILPSQCHAPVAFHSEKESALPYHSDEIVQESHLFPF